jgi:hypothetical protein
MKKEELKILVSISIAIASLIAITYLCVLNKSIDSKSILRSVSFGISGTTLFWTFYFSFGWKWPILNLMFYRPNLNGTWSGEIISDWKDENQKSIPPIGFKLVVRQSFLRIHFTSFTKDFVGVSYSETFSIKKHTGLKNISYLYRKDTSQKSNDILQEGATELRLIEGDIRTLQGKYWSSIKTNGTINVVWISKEHADSWNEAKKLQKNE